MHFLPRLAPSCSRLGTLRLRQTHVRPTNMAAVARAVQAAARAGSRSMSTEVAGISKVGVVGLGLMGHGIAQVTAQKGFEVVAVEASEEAVSRGMGMIASSLNTVADRAVKKGKVTQEAADAETSAVLGRISTATDRGALADCDLVIEAIVENLDVKKELYTDLGRIVKPSGILATNTSSLNVGDMIEASGRGDKLVGLHYFNPVQIMQLVEVVRTDVTSTETFDAAMAFAQAQGKTAVACTDTPGFIVNRLLVPYMAQAIALFDRGVGSKADIDKAMQLGCGYPMGPLTLADYVGLDTCLFILQGWVQQFPEDPAFFVPPLLESMVAEGKLGRKSGQGFYTWKGNKVVG